MKNFSLLTFLTSMTLASTTWAASTDLFECISKPENKKLPKVQIVEIKAENVGEVPYPYRNAIRFYPGDLNVLVFVETSVGVGEDRNTTYYKAPEYDLQIQFNGLEMAINGVAEGAYVENLRGKPKRISLICRDVRL